MLLFKKPIVTCVKVFLVNPDGESLILRRSKTHPTQALMADIPGGEVETGEHIEDALVREVEEEIHLAIDREGLQMVYADTSKNHDGASITRLFYVRHLDATPKDIVLSWEHDQFEWRSV